MIATPAKTRLFIDQIERSARLLMKSHRVAADARALAALDGLEVTDSTWAEWDEAWSRWHDPVEAAKPQVLALTA